MQLPDIKEIEAYIRSTASQMGIDPDIAVRVAKSEGLAPGVWQSNVMSGGVREPSYGPFQLYENGGLGNKFKQLYGKSASDPSTWKQQVDFALAEAKKGGWSPWYGAKKAGIGNFEGLRAGASSPGAPNVSGPLAGPAANMPRQGQMAGPSFSPSQGPGEAQKLGFMEMLNLNKSRIGGFGDALSALAPAQSQQQAVPEIGPATGYAPMQVQQTRYTSGGKPQMDPSLLRKLGLI